MTIDADGTIQSISDSAAQPGKSNSVIAVTTIRFDIARLHLA